MGQQIEFRGGQRHLVTVRRDPVLRPIHGDPADRERVLRAGPAARRTAALTQATSSRGLNGLVM